MNGLFWYALWVKSRSEFVTSQELSRKGIENYVPAATKVRQWADRKKKVDFPLFPGYVFVHVFPRADEFLNVVKTRGSVCFVSLEPGRPTSIPPQEIESLKILTQSGNRFDVFPAFQEGTPVRVKRGPLSGAVGILAKRKDQNMFLVKIDILGRSVGTSIYAEDIEPA
jgi:transcription termination/antitermination protein NusG